jgi:peptidoglycan/xylan/chitin deacetylase (PgdA/CDA1 family)
MRARNLAVGIIILAGLGAWSSHVRSEARRLELEIAQWAEQGAGEIIWRVPTDRKVVALTIDDGPDPKYTPTVLAIARQKGIRLTFFLVGREVQAHPDLARREVAEGHAIGNHTWDHPLLLRDTAVDDAAEIKRCGDVIEAVCGRRARLFRPPWGLWDDDAFVEAERQGYRMILWTVAVEHHSAQTPEAMAQRVLQKVRPGTIILAHDGEPNGPIDRSKTMQALPLIIDRLRERGYRFVTVPELLRIGRRAQ